MYLNFTLQVKNNWHVFYSTLRSTVLLCYDSRAIVISTVTFNVLK